MKTPLEGKERIKVLLVRPPCHLWPIINESDNFLLPLGLPCIGAYLREKMEGVEVRIVDCLPLKIGWKSLGPLIEAEAPDVVGVGDMVVYMHEGVKALKLAKERVPDVVTVAGGQFHSPMSEYSLTHFPDLDFVVRYEGEETLRELLETLRAGGDPASVRSVSYRKNGRVEVTDPRPLIDDLDTLPMPAYDLMPLDRYSPFGLLWPKAVTIQAGRGCPYNCNFCSWSALEGEHVRRDGRDVLIPRYRTKSPEQVVREVELLYEKYGVRYLFWVDGTWNLDAAWLDAFCSEIIRRDYKLGWWAFVRADLLLQQEKEGVLEKMVRAGFRHTLIGGERPVQDELELIGKTDISGGALVDACHLLEKKYPQVFRQATFLTGIRTETPASMERLGRYTRDVHLDFAAFHPFMPFPGTPVWETAQKENWIEETNFQNYDMFYPIMPSETMSREEISHYTQTLYQDFIRKQPIRYPKGMFSVHKIRRRLHWWFLFSIGRVIMKDLVNAMLGRKRFEGFAAVNKLWKPKWYDG